MDLGYNGCLERKILGGSGLSNGFQIISLNQFSIPPNWKDIKREMST